MDFNLNAYNRAGPVDDKTGNNFTSKFLTFGLKSSKRQAAAGANDKVFSLFMSRKKLKVSIRRSSLSMAIIHIRTVDQVTTVFLYPFIMKYRKYLFKN